MIVSGTHLSGLSDFSVGELTFSTRLCRPSLQACLERGLGLWFAGVCLGNAESLHIFAYFCWDSAIHELISHPIIVQ